MFSWCTWYLKLTLIRGRLTDTPESRPKSSFDLFPSAPWYFQLSTLCVSLLESLAPTTNFFSSKPSHQALALEALLCLRARTHVSLAPNNLEMHINQSHLFCAPTITPNDVLLPLKHLTHWYQIPIQWASQFQEMHIKIQKALENLGVKEGSTLTFPSWKPISKTSFSETVPHHSYSLDLLNPPCGF